MQRWLGQQPAETLDMPVTERCLKVARILQDRDIDDQKFSTIVDVMIKLWGKR